jgi:hypothetical protein
MDVYVAVVMYLKSQMFRYLKTKLTELKPHDIHWILTVPSHASETMFLKEVADRVNISFKRYKISNFFLIL